MFFYHQGHRRAHRLCLSSLPWAWSAHPELCPIHQVWRRAGTAQSPTEAMEYFSDDVIHLKGNPLKEKKVLSN